jgi:glycosyltransferase involved in cell wall biosynthesis
VRRNGADRNKVRVRVRILVVSSYPPRPCGIGAYAAAQVDRLKADGHDVVVLSPPDGSGDFRVPFCNGRVFDEAARRGHAFERIIVHFQPGLYYRPGVLAAASKIRTSLALLRLVDRRPQTEILIHEGIRRPKRWRPDHSLVRRALSRATVLFHTQAEWRALERDLRIRVRGQLVDHRGGVIVRDRRARDDARRGIGVRSSDVLFLCAGFLHPEKGYERAVKAFAEAGAPGWLMIVGSVRDPIRENLSYLAVLRDLAAETDGVDLLETYLRDEDFDTWLRAATYVVLPYTHAWSSGVLARAAVIGTPAIVSAVGGLAEQAGPDDEVFETDDDLRRLFRRLGRSTASNRSFAQAQRRRDDEKGVGEQR